MRDIKRGGGEEERGGGRKREGGGEEERGRGGGRGGGGGGGGIISTDLIRVPRLLLEPLLGDVMPLGELKLALGDVQPPGLFLWQQERGMLQLVVERVLNLRTHTHTYCKYMPKRLYVWT